MILNFTNHPSSDWPKEQITAAVKQFQKVEDLPFPSINPEWDSDKLDYLAEEYLDKIKEMHPSAVHIMGEMNFTFRLIELLKKESIPCYASTTERLVTEEKNGSKTATFRFIRFRKY